MEAQISVPETGVISFHNINYFVNDTKAGMKCKNWCSSSVANKSDKQVLFDFSGVFRPGMNAIMGKKTISIQCFK